MDFMKRLLFSFPENETLTKKLSDRSGLKIGKAEFGRFPDGESKFRIDEELAETEIYVVCSLDRPDSKIVPLLFFSETARSLGAEKIHLVAPYLCYMRQDKVFHPGEGISSRYFASLISRYVDSVLTIDPHLHRIHNLEDIFSVKATTLHATQLFAEYIRKNVKNPILIGPDSESSQWVSEVAKESDSPFTILEKNRKGDRDVEVSVPQIETYRNHTPVLIDDIVSTGKTLLKTIAHLKNAGMQAPICLCVHGIFADNSYRELIESGANTIITTNTIDHVSNRIDISALIAETLF